MTRALGTDAAVAEVQRRVAEVLRRAGVPSPDADARWLVAAASGIDPHRDPAAAVPDEARTRLDGLVARRAAREPLQLVLGATAFRSLEVGCRPGVFVPRPETEMVAGLAIEAARDRRGAGARVVVVEPCTGTGAIACSVAAEVPGARVVAADRDPAAVALARHNVARLAAGAAGVPGPAPGSDVEVVVSDLLDGVDAELRGRVDVLVANPPYLPASDRHGWDPEVADHDPDAALVGGPDGHEVVDALLHLAVAWLAPGGTVVLEIDSRRAADAVATAARAGLAGARVVTDLTGADRAVVATAAEPAAG